MSNNPQQSGRNTAAKPSRTDTDGITVRRDPTPSGDASDSLPARPCVICDEGVGGGSPTDTTNRALFTVNRRTTIEPVCEQHDTQSPAVSTRRILTVGGIKFLAEAITAGVVSKSDATTHLTAAQEMQLAELLEV